MKVMNMVIWLVPHVSFVLINTKQECIYKILFNGYFKLPWNGGTLQLNQERAAAYASWAIHNDKQRRIECHALKRMKYE